VVSPIGVQFENPSLLISALKHKSAWSHAPEVDNNERLEFLGDAVIEVAVSDFLFSEQPELSEGKMTRLRSALVNTVTLARACEELKIKDHILVGEGERERGLLENDRLLASVFEALVGAIYLDQGFDTAKSWVQERLKEYRHEGEEALRDYKTRFQEIIQSELSITPDYEIVSEQGPKHQPVFVARVMVDGYVKGLGEGKTKKEAEQNAARDALMQMESLNDEL
jgi:ribonuclease-3